MLTSQKVFVLSLLNSTPQLESNVSWVLNFYYYYYFITTEILWWVNLLCSRLFWSISSVRNWVFFVNLPLLKIFHRLESSNPFPEKNIKIWTDHVFNFFCEKKWIFEPLDWNCKTQPTLLESRAHPIRHLSEIWDLRGTAICPGK